MTLEEIQLERAFNRNKRHKKEQKKAGGLHTSRKNFGDRFERPAPGGLQKLNQVPNSVHSDRPVVDRSRSRHNNFRNYQGSKCPSNELSTDVPPFLTLERLLFRQVLRPEHQRLLG